MYRTYMGDIYRYIHIDINMYPLNLAPFIVTVHLRFILFLKYLFN